MNIKVISFYHFFKPDFNLEIMRMSLRLRMIELELRGTILLATEGINASLAGPIEEIDLFMAFFKDQTHINPTLKVSYCEKIPFKRTLVKIKSDIVCPPGTTPIDPSENPVPFLSPSQLHQWIQEGRQMVLLDTRNDYEYEVGRFKGSVHLGTRHFADFEKDLEKAPEQWKDIPVVTFCTGGIRCEKASPLMIKKGFRKVYQLEGGILNYFEKIGRGNFEGNCFVFDQRVSLNDQLNPTITSSQAPA
jgi:UPF0176 protein